MKTFFESMIVAFAMYSKIPVPRIDWNERNMRYCICFFPLIGLAVGAVMAGVYFLCMALGTGDIFRAALLAVMPVIVTGGIHVDGLLDTSDALSSFKSREEKLEILKDSHTGAFAIIIGICFFLLYTGVCSEIDEKNILQIAVGFVMSRALSGFALATFPKARGSGLLKTFADAADAKKVSVVMLIYAACCFGVLIVISPVRGIAMTAAALLVTLWYHKMSMDKFGGITGDLEGFYLEINELIMAAVGVLI